MCAPICRCSGARGKIARKSDRRPGCRQRLCNLIERFCYGSFLQGQRRQRHGRTRQRSRRRGRRRRRRRSPRRSTGPAWCPHHRQVRANTCKFICGFTETDSHAPRRWACMLHTAETRNHISFWEVRRRSNPTVGAVSHGRSRRPPCCPLTQARWVLYVLEPTTHSILTILRHSVGSGAPGSGSAFAGLAAVAGGAAATPGTTGALAPGSTGTGSERGGVTPRTGRVAEAASRFGGQVGAPPGVSG